MTHVGRIVAVNAYGSTAKPSGRKVLAFLLLPATLQVRLVFLGVILLVVGAVVEVGVILLPGLLIVNLAVALFIWALVVAVRDRRRRHKHLTLAGTVRVAAGVLVIYFVVAEGPLALRFIATGGAGSARLDSNSSSLMTVIDVFATFTLPLITVWLLVGVPQRLFRIKLDIHGDQEVQPVLLGFLTTAASALAAIYILVLHFGGGPLSGVRPGPLVAGIIGTVLLVAPLYRSLARACWQRGVAGVFSPRAFKQRWGKTLTELAKALNRDAGKNTAPNSEIDATVEKARP